MSVRHSHPQTTEQKLLEHRDQAVYGSLKESIRFILDMLGENDDFVIRRFRLFHRYDAALLYISNLKDEEVISRDILKPLMIPYAHLDQPTQELSRLQDVITCDALYHSVIDWQRQLVSLVDSILRGRKVLLVDGLTEAASIGSRHVEKRSINQPETEQTVRGPREGFIEQLGTNISLLRYRLPTADFRVKMMEIGRLTKSKVAVCFIEGVANPELVDEVFDRLQAIQIDGILDTGYLEQFIEENHFSPFPQVQNSERPDKVVANLLEGRVAILADGSPFALIVPVVFSQFYQTTEDYSERFILSSFVRIARVVALVFSLIFPSLYVSVISFNPELIPTEFAVAVAGGRAGVPFPAVMEVLIMEVSMEVLREATVRLPQQVGGALSIVGVLVVGQAAVSAGFASPITVVVIALTTIGSFATPAYNVALALRLLRFPLVLLSGIFGLYGLMVGLIIIGNHMLSLRSYGVPYMTPIAPGNWQGMKDTVFRAPFWTMTKRPQHLQSSNQKRLGGLAFKLRQPPGNTLEPVKTGNQRWDDTDGISTPDHADASNRDFD